MPLLKFEKADHYANTFYAIVLSDISKKPMLVVPAEPLPDRGAAGLTDVKEPVPVRMKIQVDTVVGGP
jgi:hypothetical protein